MLNYDWREIYIQPTSENGYPSGPSVLKTGHPDADTILILVGGKEGTANGFNVLARNVAALDSNIEVWSVNRREAELADTSYATGDLDAAVEYYIRDRSYERPSADAVATAATRGLDALLEDIRTVVTEARTAGKSKVLLGGHSVGAAAAAHFASWDFDGTPGYRLVDGLVLIDGGIHDAFSGAGMNFDIDEPTAQGWLAGINNGGAFEDESSTSAVLGFDGPPETAAIFYHISARLLLERPDGTSPLLTEIPARYGFSSDSSATNFDVFRALTAVSGAGGGHAVTTNATSAGNAPTRLGSVAHSHAIAGGAFQWYTSNRTLLDFIVADSFRPTPLSEQFGLRNIHGADIDVPIYSFASAFTNGSSTRSAQWLADFSQVEVLTIESDDHLTHHDLLWADLPSNTLARGLADFARAIAVPDGAHR
ncbi:hypothetical protein CH253_16855 [Rhodococcus sp. 06-156-3C]|uniref:hypothetical protein n=1 Tax=Nocardiaceae TaxID=85025 RepID=UPI000522F302|nr:MULTISPECIES: hypothetical protein [Rhodococcus]OZD18156.1 hypothetical protein CH280_06180 [Rhodococcus sp. 06-156-4C]OZD18753.1 hypothetical protein CH253_16855 [Rhodococcus sp. 06-156-3C]OZD22263.1 hypothetical protein CH248_08440 [Rhodococcus sp. 06-156-4a]OZD34069.1 hypothetical protein CH247_08265 [Rhodococcus sp. 06-156-3b]OZD38806.1 hypothetical protein CH284_06685 [Rhodococcus sp. 06-156-3]